MAQHRQNKNSTASTHLHRASLECFQTLKSSCHHHAGQGSSHNDHHRCGSGSRPTGQRRRRSPRRTGPAGHLRRGEWRRGRRRRRGGPIRGRRGRRHGHHAPLFLQRSEGITITTLLTRSLVAVLGVLHVERVNDRDPTIHHDLIVHYRHRILLPGRALFSSDVGRCIGGGGCCRGGGGGGDASRGAQQQRGTDAEQNGAKEESRGRGRRGGVEGHHLYCCCRSVMLLLVVSKKSGSSRRKK